ncbi:MAG: DUF2267 domain-containing protein [Candidatus Omnitrophota bacterium]
MTMTSLHVFDETIQKSEAWLKGLEQDLHTEDPQHAYSALRSVLHALRDRLSPEEAVDLAAQLPLLIKGVFFDGWNPAKQPVKLSDPAEFTEYMQNSLNDNVDAQMAVKSVFKLLNENITCGEIRHVKSNLPDSIQALWDQAVQ